MHLQAGSATDVGLVRANNQDQMLLAAPIFAVADGMGGHAAGEVASQVAVEAFRRAFELADPSPAGVLQAAHAANGAVWEAAQASADLRGMGTTLTALALVPDDGDDRLAVVNVGDSRTYHLHGGSLRQLTVDHSYVAELVAEGRIDEAEAEVHPQRHVLTRALGISPEIDIDLLVVAPVPGDRYLLCSDGLSREVSDDEVASTLRRLADPGDAARELVAAAKFNGGSDNITVVVVDVVEDGDGDEPGETSTAEADGDLRTQVLPAIVALEAESDPTTSSVAPVAAPRATAPAAPRATAPVTPQATSPPAAPTPPAPMPPTVPPPTVPQATTPATPRVRLVTVRVIGFMLALVAVVVVAAFGTEYYARSTYFVGLHDEHVTIFQGRPGGVLWWKSTISERTTLTSASVLAYHLPALRSGVQESSLAAARSYVTHLHQEKLLATPTTTTPTATTTPTTTAPRTTVRPPTTRHHHRTTATTRP